MKRQTEKRVHRDSDMKRQTEKRVHRDSDR